MSASARRKIIEMHEEITKLREQVAAQAAVIEKLREALIAGWSLQCDFDDARRLADDALALSTDSTQILAEVRRAERERVAQYVQRLANRLALLLRQSVLSDVLCL